MTEKDLNQVVGVLRNQQNAAEGPVLPPRQNGGPFRVPFVSNFAVAQTTTFIGGTQFVLTFLEPEQFKAQIDHYNIFIGGLDSNVNILQGPSSVNGSPAVIRITTAKAQKVIFYAQTVLKSGLVSDLPSSPTCTGSTIAGTISGLDIPPGTITLQQMASGTEGSLITYGASGVPQLLTPGVAGQVLSTQGAGALPTYINVPTLLFIETTNATVASTAAETSLVGAGIGSMTIPSNFFAAGRTVAFKASGFHSCVSNTTLRVKLKAGSVVLLDSGVVNVVNATSNGWNLDAVITCYTNGASGTFWVQGSYANLGPIAFISNQLFNTSTVVIDTTVNELLDLTVQWGASSASNTITSTNLYLQSLN